MKILTGTFSGRPIPFAAHPGLRPTADKVRKALSDMLRPRIEGQKVLDLFAGTGALGLEALSMGAAEVAFVEIDKAQANKIRKNLEHFEWSDKARVINADAVEMIKKSAGQAYVYDVVLLDPPYEAGLGEKTLIALSGSTLIGRDSIVVFECGKRESAPEKVGRLISFKNKTYGDTQIVIYRTEDGSTERTVC